MAKSNNESTLITNLSPFKLAKDINEITKSKIAKVTIHNNTYILLETNNKEQSNLLLATNQTCDIPVSVSPHRSLNLKRVLLNVIN